MRRILLTCMVIGLFLAGCQPLAAATPTFTPVPTNTPEPTATPEPTLTPTPAGSSVQGRVYWKETEDAMAGATVTLSVPDSNPEVSFTAMTDDAGNFSIADAPAGIYQFDITIPIASDQWGSCPRLSMVFPTLEGEGFWETGEYYSATLAREGIYATYSQLTLQEVSVLVLDFVLACE